MRRVGGKKRVKKRFVSVVVLLTITDAASRVRQHQDTGEEPRATEIELGEELTMGEEAGRQAETGMNGHDEY